MITVNGGKRNQRKYALSMAAYVCKKFNVNPTVEINFRRMSKDENYGYCCELEDSEYEVDIKRTLNMRTMLMTLAHEMVHVKQYARRELHPVNDTWCGKTYNPKKTSYWDLPWEIEAHGREVGLFVRWAEKERVAHLKWTQTGSQ